MSTISVVVQSSNPFCNDNGNFLFPGETYKVTINDCIKEGIDNGQLTEVVEEVAPVADEAPAQTESKPPTKSKARTSAIQETGEL